MTDCDHLWATQDEIGRPYCQACGKPWEQVRKEEAMNRHRCECSICTERGDEIERLQEAKRRALALADERVKEANELRSELELLRHGLKEIVDFVDPLPRAVVREACAELLREKPKP